MRHRIVIAAVIALSLLACAKKRPGETPQESVARKGRLFRSVRYRAARMGRYNRRAGAQRGRC